MPRSLPGRASVVLLVYLSLQSMMVIAHEFTHSGSAWLLGETTTPFTVQWGNPLTMRGWDEGVPYDALFHGTGHVAEAVIGGSPLLLHIALVAISLALLLRPWMRSWPRAALLLYLLVLANLGELVAYLFMRPFIPTGDTGRFNQGLALSPWPLFLIGGGLTLLFLFLLARKAGPVITVAIGTSRLERRALSWAAGFTMFLWCSGLRMLTLYPDPLWKAGLIGFPLLAAWIAVDDDRFAGPVSAR